MGCDIHLHIEVKIDGKWEHYREHKVPRSYPLFALLANVRNEEKGDFYYIEPIALPRGLPNDMTKLTRLDADYWQNNRHNHSYLVMEDFIELQSRWSDFLEKQGMDAFKHDLEHTYFGYLQDNSWAGFAKCPEYRQQARYLGITDFRFVFWFDN